MRLPRTIFRENTSFSPLTSNASSFSPKSMSCPSGARRSTSASRSCGALTVSRMTSRPTRSPAGAGSETRPAEGVSAGGGPGLLCTGASRSGAFAASSAFSRMRFRSVVSQKWSAPMSRAVFSFPGLLDSATTSQWKLRASFTRHLAEAAEADDADALAARGRAELPRVGGAPEPDERVVRRDPRAEQGRAPGEVGVARELEDETLVRDEALEEAAVRRSPVGARAPVLGLPAVRQDHAVDAVLLLGGAAGAAPEARVHHAPDRDVVPDGHVQDVPADVRRDADDLVAGGDGYDGAIDFTKCTSVWQMLRGVGRARAKGVAWVSAARDGRLGGGVSEKTERRRTRRRGRRTRCPRRPGRIAPRGWARTSPGSRRTRSRRPRRWPWRFASERATARAEGVARGKSWLAKSRKWSQLRTPSELRPSQPCLPKRRPFR